MDQCWYNNIYYYILRGKSLLSKFSCYIYNYVGSNDDNNADNIDIKFEWNRSTKNNILFKQMWRVTEFALANKNKN